jgi:hypothetical protein
LLGLISDTTWDFRHPFVKLITYPYLKSCASRTVGRASGQIGLELDLRPNSGIT